MNILEVYSSFFPNCGGVQRHIYDLCESTVKLGEEPHVLAWNPSTPPFETIDGIKVHRIRMPRLFSYARYPLIILLSLHILQLVRRHKIDLIHAHDYLPGLAATFTGVFLNKPVIVTFHLPIQTTTYYPPFRIPLLSPLEKLLKKCFILFVSKIICVSKFTHEETLRLGFPPSKIKLIYNWVMSLPMKNVQLNEKLQKFNLNKKPFLFSVGRLSENQKRFSTLIHALKLLLDKGHNLDLVIVGEGPDKEVYQKYSERLNVKNHIHFLNYVSDTDLEILYNECELFVLPSCLESLPLVLLEAMNYGKPIVATNVGGIPEVIENGYNGILVNTDYRDLFLGIEKLLSTPYIGDAFGKRSKEIIMEKFSERNCEASIALLMDSCKKIAYGR